MDKKNKIPDEADPEQIELHSREVNDLLGDPPAWLIYTGSFFLYGILALLFLGAALISYPDVVTGRVEIDDLANVEWVVSNFNGPIEIFVKNNSLVRRGDTIGMIQNPASLEDVKRFCRLLTNVERYYKTNDTELLRKFHFDLIMGEMSGAYENFTQAVRSCLIFDDYSSYEQRKAFLQKELNILKKEPEKNELAILKMERDLFELSISHKMEREKNRKQLELAYESMVNSIKNWESRYLIKSNNEGHVVFGETWALGHMVNRGDTICSVISNNQEKFVGRMQLSQEKVAGIDPGNRVNIRLTKYPSQTYGILTGEVSSIFFVPYNKKYAIDIVFPGQLTTTAQKEIRYELGLKGQAEIITSSRSVLSRIFNPIYNLLF